MVTSANGVTMIGYTDINSRLASTSSSLYANNQMKWILSAGPTTTKVRPTRTRLVTPPCHRAPRPHAGVPRP